MSLPLALPLTQQIQNYQPDNNEQHLCFYDSSYGEYPPDCSYDVIKWGTKFEIFDFYEQSKLEEMLPPQMEGEDDQVYFERVIPQTYDYDEDGNPIESKFKFPEIRPFPVSDRAIMADFDDPKVQQKTIQLLKMCGKDVTRITILSFSGDFVTEILKYLPKVKTIFVHFFEMDKSTFGKGYRAKLTMPDFKFLQTLTGIDSLLIDYTASEKKPHETEHHILDFLSKNKSLEELEKLELKYFDHVSQQEIETLLDSLPNLKKFKIEGKAVSKEIVEMILQKLKKLEDLSICYYNVKVPKDFIEKMKIKYPHIKIGDYSWWNKGW